MWLLLAGSAAAAVLEVSADGSGPYASIDAALLEASDGDTIELGPGSYATTVDLGSLDLSLVGVDGAETTVLDAGGEAFALRASGSVTISGLTVHNLGGRGLFLEGEERPLLEDVHRIEGERTAGRFHLRVAPELHGRLVGGSARVELSVRGPVGAMVDELTFLRFPEARSFFSFGFSSSSPSWPSSARASSAYVR